MTIPADPSSPHPGSHPPSSRNKSPRTPPRSRSNSREEKFPNETAPMTIPKPPFSSSGRAPTTPDPNSSRQIIAAPHSNSNSSHLNPQWQIHDLPVPAVPAGQKQSSSSYARQNSPPLYNRKNPPPPPPPRSPPRSPKKVDGGSDVLAAAAQELHRAYSEGSSNNNPNARRGSRGSNFSEEDSNNNNSSRRRRSNSFGNHGENNNYDSRSSMGSSRGNHPPAHTAASSSFQRSRSNSGNSSSGREGGIVVYSGSNGNGQYQNYPLSDSARDFDADVIIDGEGDHNNNGDVVVREQKSDYEEEESIDDEGPKSCMGRLFGALLCIFPKVEPLPWVTFAMLTLWSAIPPACFILFFTQMGFGEQIYYTIAAEMGEHAYGLALGLTVFIFALYMLDADEWTSHCGSVFLDFCILAIVCGIVLLVLLIADRFPYGMVCLFAVFHPLWLLAFKLMFYDEKDTRVFVSWLSGPLFFTSVLIAVAWVAWVFSDPDNEWNVVARMSAAERTGCQPNYDDYPECQKEAGSEETCFYVEYDEGKEYLEFPEGCDSECISVYNDCSNGFILWVGPVLVSMTTFFLSFFCTFLRTEGAREKDVLNFGAVWIFILFAMWVTTSLAGTAGGITAALAALTLASFVASAMFVAVSFSREERSQNAAAVFDRLQEKYGKHLDVARALFVVTCAPIVLVYLGLSMMNQFVRRTGLFPCSQPPGEQGETLTSRTRYQVNVMKSWDRAKVSTYAIYWGIAFMILQVLVGNLTIVFLSWMIEKTADFGLAAVTAIMCAVGVMMFLLPPVPGVPVYLTLGIVLPAQGHKQLGWAGSIVYSIGIGLLLKLFSSALQQKLIGEKLSHYVKVRQFVGVNSTLMKAMRLVLGKSGISVPKVAILIGGPDWPTSVLCGIMRLYLPQIMLGTIPIVFLIFPTCLTGALLLMASLETEPGRPEFPWAGTVSAITASLTALVQFGSMIVAAYYLEQTAGNRAADVDAIPDDREVKEADDKAAHLRRCYEDVTQWNVIPLAAKLVLQTSLACIITACYMVQLFANLCFKPHSLTDTIDENLDGKVSNLFLPLGWLSVGLFCISIILIYLFKSWGEQKAYKVANGIVVSVSPDRSPDYSSAADTPERRVSGNTRSEDVARRSVDHPPL